MCGAFFKKLRNIIQISTRARLRVWHHYLGNISQCFRFSGDINQSRLVQPVLCMRCNQANVSASIRRFHDSDSTPVFSNQVILLVPFGYQKPAGAFMRQKCAVSSALCQESSALQRIISAVTYHIPWTERMVELHSAMKASKL